MCHPVLYNFVVVANIFLYHGATLICNDRVHPPSSPSVGKLYRNREGWSRFASGERRWGDPNHTTVQNFILLYTHLLSHLYSSHGNFHRKSRNLSLYYSFIEIGGSTTWTGDLKCREVKTCFCRRRSMHTGSSETLIGWKSGKTTSLYGIECVAMDSGVYAILQRLFFSLDIGHYPLNSSEKTCCMIVFTYNVCMTSQSH
jgi:hypothetical protein